MNGSFRKLVLPITLGVVVFTVSGCKKKKPAVPAPQAEAPTLEVPKPAPPATTEPATTTATTTETTTTTPPAEPPAPKPKRSKPRVAKKPSAGVPAATNNPTQTPPPVASNGTTPPPPMITMPSGKVIVPEGGVSEPTGQISTTMPASKESETKLVTERSLQNIENNLKTITWTPSIGQKTMIDQIRTYITQSRSANSEGDVVRASNLAQKAHLLCDELLKR